MKKLVIATAFLLIASTAYAGHPEIEKAQQAIENAIHDIDNAQKWHEEHHHPEFGGHANKAKELLHDAIRQLREGDKWNNEHK
jgi:hypothetical protein